MEYNYFNHQKTYEYNETLVNVERFMVDKKIVSVASLQRELSLSYPKARDYVELFCELGLLKSIGGISYSFSYDNIAEETIEKLNKRVEKRKGRRSFFDSKKNDDEIEDTIYSKIKNDVIRLQMGVSDLDKTQDVVFVKTAKIIVENLGDALKENTDDVLERVKKLEEFFCKDCKQIVPSVLDTKEQIRDAFENFHKAVIENKLTKKYYELVCDLFDVVIKYGDIDKEELESLGNWRESTSEIADHPFLLTSIFERISHHSTNAFHRICKRIEELGLNAQNKNEEPKRHNAPNLVDKYRAEFFDEDDDMHFNDSINDEDEDDDSNDDESFWEAFRREHNDGEYDDLFDEDESEDPDFDEDDSDENEDLDEDEGSVNAQVEEKRQDLNRTAFRSYFDIIADHFNDTSKKITNAYKETLEVLITNAREADWSNIQKAYLEAEAEAKKGSEFIERISQVDFETHGKNILEINDNMRVVDESKDSKEQILNILNLLKTQGCYGIINEYQMFELYLNATDIQEDELVKLIERPKDGSFIDETTARLVYESIKVFNTFSASAIIPKTTELLNVFLKKATAPTPQTLKLFIYECLSAKFVNGYANEESDLLKLNSIELYKALIENKTDEELEKFINDIRNA